MYLECTLEALKCKATVHTTLGFLGSPLVVGMCGTFTGDN